MRPLDPSCIRTPRSLSPVWLWALLSYSQAHRSYSLYLGPRHAQTSRQSRTHAFSGPLLHATPCSLVLCPVSSIVFSVRMRSWLEFSNLSQGQTWLCQEARTWHFVLLKGSLSFAIIHCVPLPTPNFPSIILSSFMAFNVRKVPLLLPHGWKQKASSWLEKQCCILCTNI